MSEDVYYLTPKAIMVGVLSEYIPHEELVNAEDEE